MIPGPYLTPAHPFDQVLQDLHFDQSLMMESLLVPNDLDSDALAGFVVAALQHLTEGSLTQETHDFVTIC